MKIYSFRTVPSIIQAALLALLSVCSVLSVIFEAWKVIPNLWIQSGLKFMLIYLMSFFIVYAADMLIRYFTFKIVITKDEFSFCNWQWRLHKGSIAWDKVSLMHFKNKKYFVKVGNYIFRLPNSLPNYEALVNDINQHTTTSSEKFVTSQSIKSTGLFVRIVLIFLIGVLLTDIVVQDHMTLVTKQHEKHF